MVVELRFGEGGQDAKLFVHELAAVYLKYGAHLGFDSQTLTSEEGHVILRFRGEKVWQAFRHEGGKHAVQRVPAAERGERRQTSMISVAVLPLPPAGADQALPERELEVKTQTGRQKAGGQNVNKVASAVRMRHLPTGLTVFINGRDQAQNRKEAVRVLTAKVNALRREKQEAAYVQARKDQMGDGGRGNKVRTYNFIGGGRVVDHRLGRKTNQLKEVMKGRLDLLLDSVE